MNNKELMNQILSELKNLKNLDYSKSEDEVLNNKNLILDKIRKLLSQIDSLKIEEEKQITEAINNIRISNLEASILESIEIIKNVINNHKDDKEDKIEEKDKGESKKDDDLGKSSQPEVVNEEQPVKQNEKIEQLTNELVSLSDSNYVTKITAKRGRLIREIQREISKLKRSGKEDEKTLDALEQLETKLSIEIENHKNQLNDRYSKEFSEKEATVPAILTVLPMGVALQATKVETCIREMVAAKTNKQRIFAAVNVAKALGMTVATPVIFTVKFIIKHWYLLLLLLSLIKLPHFNFKPKSELEPEYEPEYEPDPATVPVRDPATVPVRDPSTVTVPHTVPNPGTVPHTVPNPGGVVVGPTSPEQNPGYVQPGLVTSESTVSEEVAARNYAYSLAKAFRIAQNHSYQADKLVFNDYNEAANYVRTNYDPETLEMYGNMYGIDVKNGNYDEVIRKFLTQGDPVTGNRASIEWLIGDKGIYKNEQELMEAYKANELIGSNSLEGITILEHLSQNPQIITQLENGDITELANYIMHFITPGEIAVDNLTGFITAPALEGEVVSEVVSESARTLAEKIAESIAKGAPAYGF